MATCSVLYRRIPKRGFNPIKSIGIAKLNIGKIQSFIDNKKIKANKKINIDLLKKLKLINTKNSKQAEGKTKAYINSA